MNLVIITTTVVTDKNSNNVSTVLSAIYTDGKYELLKILTFIQYSFIHSFIQQAS